MPRSQKSFKRTTKETRNLKVASNQPEFDPRDIRTKTTSRLEPKNEVQARYIHAIETAQVIFAVGPAGTGKTFIAATYAAQQLLAKQIDRIIITRPNEEVGKGMGFLPGELSEKYAPYLAPFKEVVASVMGRTHYEYCLKFEKISPQPLAYMRGATFREAIVILDEAQNCTPEEMKMFLTRIGENCVVIVDGDTEQCDLNGPSGLNDALRRLKDVPGVDIIQFEDEDIVRSGIVRDIVKAYRHN